MSRLSIGSLLAIIAFMFTITFAPVVGAIEQPGLNLIKSADKTSAGLGDNITYTYIIKNTDNVSIGSLKLIDDKLGPIYLVTDVLQAGENLTVTRKYTVRITDFQQPVITNNATVTGIRSNGDNITASDNATVNLIPYKAPPNTAEILMTKAEILKLSGVPGQGIDKAPGLKKPFNPKSNAADKAGKKKTK